MDAYRSLSQSSSCDICAPFRIIVTLHCVRYVEKKYWYADKIVFIFITDLISMQCDTIRSMCVSWVCAMQCRTTKTKYRDSHFLMWKFCVWCRKWDNKSTVNVILSQVAPNYFIHLFYFILFFSHWFLWYFSFEFPVLCKITCLWCFFLCVFFTFIHSIFRLNIYRYERVCECDFCFFFSRRHC